MPDFGSSFYITTAIDYVNAPPHLGHAYEKIASDVVARFQKMLGKDVFFLTGTDEHGTKVEKTARSRGLEPKAHTDEMTVEFKKAWDYLGIEYDRFIRTTDADHYAVVDKIWRKLADKGDIYKAAYQGLYCPGCENFVTERDLNEAGECPNHHRKPDTVAEENYFFRLSNYAEAIRKHLERHPDFVQPDFRREEVFRMLDEAADISVSRNKSSVSWGIPVPNDPEQVIYVWIDALSNYLTGIGYNGQKSDEQALFAKYWPCDVHMIGKDILRFHAVYWPAMLMAAELPLPKQVFAHGFININDAKISKSTGNVVSPFTLQERFELPNADPIRYYLMTVAAFGQDGGFTEDDFKRKINADLSNNLGNLLNRTLSMTVKYLDGIVPEGPVEAPWLAKAASKVREAYDGFDFQQAAGLTLQLVDAANKAINDQEPWTLHKNGEAAALSRLMKAVLETLRQTALMLYPMTPILCSDIWRQLGYPQSLSAMQPLWRQIEEDAISAGQVVQPAGPLLPRLDSELAGSAKKETAK